MKTYRRLNYLCLVVLSCSRLFSVVLPISVVFVRDDQEVTVSSRPERLKFTVRSKTSKCSHVCKLCCIL